jgi:hypothetical protein
MAAEEMEQGVAEELEQAEAEGLVAKAIFAAMASQGLLASDVAASLLQLMVDLPAKSSPQGLSVYRLFFSISFPFWLFMIGVLDPDPYPALHGSALNLSPGSAFQMRIRIQLLIKLAPKAKIIHII